MNTLTPIKSPTSQTANNSKVSIGDQRFSQDGNPTASINEKKPSPAVFPKTKNENEAPLTETTFGKVVQKSMANALSFLLADTYVLYVKTQSFHWNVEGQNFLSLHQMFMEQYLELSKAVDAIAERIRALGEFAPGTLAEFSELASLKEEKVLQPAKTMIESLHSDQETVIQSIRNLISMADTNHDFLTADLLTQRLQAHEKNVWILQSLLK